MQKKKKNSWLWFSRARFQFSRGDSWNGFSSFFDKHNKMEFFRTTTGKLVVVRLRLSFASISYCR